ncbi:unnamed protein product [Meganyctiphanes norvegica]|uniref:VWFD domain-containing protein n=1 Tax=Meganyctiphanes norvegica TaxID=48144 RepID=A0AAV2QRI3_MEGNR
MENEEGPQLWAAAIQGKAGETLFNARHFFKVKAATPSGELYGVTGDVHSDIADWNHIDSSISLSAKLGSESSFLISWTLQFEQENQNTVSFELIDENKPVLHLDTTLRAQIPGRGESKLKIKSVQIKTPLVENDVHIHNTHKTDLEVRLVTEGNPELGRLNAALMNSPESYTFTSRLLLDRHSLAIVSYGMAQNDSTKSSHTLNLIDPKSTWQRLTISIDTDTLGSIKTDPINFQTSIDSNIIVGYEEVSSLKNLIKLTPSDLAFKLNLVTPLPQFSKANFLLQIKASELHCHLAFQDLSTVTEISWNENLNSFDVAFNYAWPGMDMHTLNGALKFKYEEFPLILEVSGRVTMNGQQHLVLNINCRSQQDQYILTGAYIKPGDSASVSLQLKNVDDSYRALGALILNGFSGQVKIVNTLEENGYDVLLTVESSALPDSRGYALRYWRKWDEISAESGIRYSQNDIPPDWVYTYSIAVNYDLDIKGRVRSSKIFDQYIYQRRSIIEDNLNFFVLNLENRLNTIDFELEFPFLWESDEVRIAGSFVQGQNPHLVIAFYILGNKHAFKANIDFDDEMWSSTIGGKLGYSLDFVQANELKRSPLTIQLQGESWNTNRQIYKFMINEESLKKGLKIEGNRNGSTETVNQTPTFSLQLISIQETRSRSYKLNWETYDTDNNANIFLELDRGHAKFSFRYERELKNINDEGPLTYELKGSANKFDSDFFGSITFYQTHVLRARAVDFRYSKEEAYTELVLDLFREEDDQITIGIHHNFTNNFGIRVGQFGNTFLELGYHLRLNYEEEYVHSIQFENSGRTLELWFGSADDAGRVCQRAGLVIATPNLAPTNNVFTICTQYNPEIIMQILGAEEHEGPYVRIGEISGPGGLGAQLGSGRLRPLDTPPAITLTAQFKNQMLELLADWQKPYLDLLNEDLSSRWSTVSEALSELQNFSVKISGSADIQPTINNFEQILYEANKKTQFFIKEIFFWIDEDLYFEQEIFYDLLSVSEVVEMIKPLHDLYIEKYRKELLASFNYVKQFNLENSFIIIREEMNPILEKTQTISSGVANVVVKVFDTNIRPPFIRIQALFTALTYGDNQSLYALISRLMGDIKRRLGRRSSIQGFLINDLLTRVERGLVRHVTWEDIGQQINLLLKYVQNITSLSITMPHDTSINLKIPSPLKFKTEIEKTWILFKDHIAPELATRSQKHFSIIWSRLQYLSSWHVEGTAVVFGWDQALTWDGRRITNILTGTCPHMLVFLVHSAIPTAITIHVQNSEGHMAMVKVLTFWSGTDKVTIDSDIKMKLNDQHIRKSRFEVGNLTITWSQNEAVVKSSEGLALLCNRERNICEVKVDERHFAGVTGLLGIFDFDFNSDIMTSEWEILTDTDEEWASSWQVPSSKTCAKLPSETGLVHHEEEKCSQLFQNEHSPFSPCFQSVQSTPYNDACLSGWSCASEAAYQRKCSQHYIDLPNTINNCDTCSTSDEDRNITNLLKEVVIISDFQCVEDIKDFVNVIYKEEDPDRSHRLLVRYIGKHQTPPQMPKEVEEVVLDPGAKAFDALEHAINFDFSRRSLKAILLFDCGNIQCNSKKRASKIENLQGRMLKQGIQLAIVTEDTIKINNPTELSNKVKKQLIGLDAYTSFTLPHARKRNVRGNPSIRPHIDIPHGNICAQLAIKTDGSVFSLEVLKRQRKKYHRRIFQQLLSLRVDAGQDREYLQCRKCTCYGPCTLCTVPNPFVYTRTSFIEEEDYEDSEDYDDSEEEEEDRKRRRKKKNRSKVKSRN